MTMFEIGAEYVFFIENDRGSETMVFGRVVESFDGSLVKTSDGEIYNASSRRFVRAVPADAMRPREIPDNM